MLGNTLSEIVGDTDEDDSRNPKKHTRKSHRHPHILNAATNLLGICFVIIGALKFSNSNDRSFADECTWVAVALLLTSAITAYLAIRNGDNDSWRAEIADLSFIAGLLTVSLSVVVAAIAL